MAAKGPDIHVDYGYAFPVRVESDTSLDFTGQVVVFRVGLPGPVAGEIAAPLIEYALTVTAARSAIGTVPTTDTDLDPAVVYGYHVSVGTGTGRYLVVHGRLTVERAVGAS